MSDRELIRTYAVAIFMITFTDEWGKLERVRAGAKLHNTISKKHNNFYKQIHEKKAQKRKSVSHKTELFVEASSCAVDAWNATMDNSSTALCVNTVIYRLAEQNKDEIKQLYGLDFSVFEELNNFNHKVILQSYKVANRLMENLNAAIDNKNNRNIYKELT